MADPRFLSPITILTDIGGVQVDITRKMEEIYPSDVSTETIEGGSDITDHSVIKPVQLILDGGFSDIQITKLLGGAVNSRRGRAKDLYDKMLSLYASQDVFDVMNGTHLFENCVFSDLRLVKDKPNFSLSFHAELRVLKIIETQDSLEVSNPFLEDIQNRARILASGVEAQSGTSSTSSLISFGIVA